MLAYYTKKMYTYANVVFVYTQT